MGQENRFIFKDLGITGRDKAAELRNKILDIVENGNEFVVVDLADIKAISFDVADELFGQLVTKLGITKFMAAVRIVNADRAIWDILDRAILSRMVTR